MLSLESTQDEGGNCSSLLLVLYVGQPEDVRLQIKTLLCPISFESFRAYHQGGSPVLFPFVQMEELQ